MITIDDIHKSFGLQEIFHGATLQINGGDRLAITGPNGAGKSTLLKVLLGEEQPDSGDVRIGRGVKISYLPQEYPPVGEGSVLQEAMKDTHEADGRVEAKCKEILMGLGFKVADFERPLKTLSGGWAMRVMMARVLLEDADLLLLDEPTNHLDLQSLLWFQERLQSWRGAIVFISHDRAFVDAVAKAIVNVEGGRLKIYPGDYEAFVAAKAAERERLETRYREQQVEIAQMEEFIMRNRARASTAGRAQSMIKRLEKLEKIELPAEAKKVHIKFPQPTRTGVRALALKDMHKAYGDLKVYQGLNIEFERGHKVAFVGPNGAGKSTMLKILAGVIPFDSGERTMGLNVNVGYYSQHRLEGLNPDNTVLKEALESNRNNGELMVRTVLGSFLFPGDSVFKKVGVLSGGEKSRLALVKLLLNPPNVMLMDEPTTHLDMASVDALIEALKAFEGTLCFISHDLYFINALADHVLHVDGGKVTWYPGNYDYFKRRQEQAAAEAPAAKPKATAPLPVLEANHAKAAPAAVHFGANHKHLPREERRRLAALAKRQEEIAALHAKIAEKTEKLQDPKIYENYDKVRKLSAEIETMQADVKKLEAAG